jgi:hypothetical protein
MGIKRVSSSAAKNAIGSTNWKAVKTMTDEEIQKAAMTDPISKELRMDELMEFKREKTSK